MRYSKKTRTFTYSGPLEKEMDRCRAEKKRIQIKLAEEAPLLNRLNKEVATKEARIKLIDEFLFSAEQKLMEDKK